jgi:mRNA interferase RelE/StbE
MHSSSPHKHWRVVYTVAEPAQVVDVLAIRRRPPYDYGNLDALVAALK